MLEILEKPAVKPLRPKMYNVILWDSPDHTAEYVVEMMSSVFGHTKEDGEKIVQNLVEDKKAVCFTTLREQAEFKCERIKKYGADQRVSGCKGGMHSTFEPV